MTKKNIFFKWYSIPLSVVGILIVYMGFQAYNKLVYKGNVENVRFKSGNIKLSGVLVKPDTPGPHPGIVLLHGAGEQTADKWFYKIHTNEFVRQGFAVLSYDKRGSGNSGGEYSKTKFPDLVNDGIAAVDFLRNQADIIHDKIGLFGVSESGWITPEIAETAGNIAFIINKNSPPLTWATTVLFELKNDALSYGISEADIDDVLTLQARIFQFYIDASKDSSVANGPEHKAINDLVSEMQNRPGAKGFFGNLTEYNAENYSIRASKYTYNPLPFLTKIDIPMLYLLAGKDINVPFEESYSLLNNLKTEYNKNITIQVYPEAGHYLYRWDMIPLEGLYSPGYLDLVGSWAKSQIDKK